MSYLKILKAKKKKIQKSKKFAIKKELQISNEELKQLKKNLANSKGKGREDRAIQTLFRTTIKNSYTLNQMLDRKANIIITVNAIIL